MRVLVIPDIHLKTWIFDRAEKILKDGKADRAVSRIQALEDENRLLKERLDEAGVSVCGCCVWRR